jgi:hypothetical protein
MELNELKMKYGNKLTIFICIPSSVLIQSPKE